jgi:hypothetical protein
MPSAAAGSSTGILVASLHTVCAGANVSRAEGAEILLELVEQGLVSFR